MRGLDIRVPLGILLGVAVLVGLLVFADGDPEPPPSPVDQSEFFGVNAPLLRDYATPELEDELEKQAEQMSARGIGWARVVFGQAVDQRLPGPIDWTIPDSVVAALARSRIRTTAMFVGTAGWAADPALVAGCGQLAPPVEVAAWGAWVGEGARRYGPGGEFWEEHPGLPNLPIRDFEVGNEQNLGEFWCPTADPEQYAAVYRAARDAMLKANSRVRPVLGGLAPTFAPTTPADVIVPDFLRRMLAADPELAGQIPAVGIHPYGPAPDDALEVVRLFREALRENGLGDVPMIANEVGWYTSGPPGSRFASDDDRADHIAELAAVIDETDCNVEGLAIHTWFSAESDPANPVDWFGIADPATGEPRQGGIAYGEAIEGERPEGVEELAAKAEGLCGP